MTDDRDEAQRVIDRAREIRRDLFHGALSLLCIVAALWLGSLVIAAVGR